MQWTPVSLPLGFRKTNLVIIFLILSSSPLRGDHSPELGVYHCCALLTSFATNVSPSSILFASAGVLLGYMCKSFSGVCTQEGPCQVMGCVPGT